MFEFVLCGQVRLYEQQRQLEEKRDTVLQEVQAMGTPEQERERLLKQVKEDNVEIASAERQYENIYRLYYLFAVCRYSLRTWTAAVSGTSNFMNLLFVCMAAAC